MTVPFLNPLDFGVEMGCGLCKLCYQNMCPSLRLQSDYAGLYNIALKHAKLYL